MLQTIETIPDTQLHPQTLSAIKAYLESVQPTVKDNVNELPQWFITNALKYKNRSVSRFQLLSTATQAVLRNVPDPKYINSLFLEQDAIVYMMQECDSLADIAFILNRHLSLKKRMKEVDYLDNVLTATKSRVDSLLKDNSGSLDSLFGVAEVEAFVQQKKNSPDSPFQMYAADRKQMEREAIVVFNYIFKPIFQKKSFQNVYELLYPMIRWFIVIRDDEDSKQVALLEMARKVNSFLWAKKTTSNIHLANTFNIILDLLSIRYSHQDAFSFETLAPLLIKLNNVPFSELINNWLSIQTDIKLIPRQVENIFRNCLNSGCITFCFKIIDHFSKQLQASKNYDALFHIFNCFIRKQYLSVKLPDGFYVKTYLQILMLYAIGFINRDRLDGETELDRLALNLSELVCKPNFKYDQCYVEIIKFFKIYENRFQFLSTTCRNLVSCLESIYKISIPVADLHMEVGNRVFRDYSADYNEDQIYSLQRSSRYAGLQNLGNTCYMNSFLQALFMTKKFNFMVIKAQDEGVVPSNQSLFQALVKLFGLLSLKNFEQRHEINPDFFKERVPQPFKSSWQQHDSEQFGRMLLDCVASQLKGTPLADKIGRLFTHQIQQKIICKGCNSERKRVQKLFGFILQLSDTPENSTPTISDLFRNYFRGYELDQNNMIMCDRCRKNRPAFVVPEPVEIAEYLITTISIFKYDKHGSSKINRALKFQFSINLKHIVPKIVTSDQIYELYAFILHIGTGVERGHYQCFARNLQQNPMLWYKFDDHYVTQMEINQIEDFHFGENETPYILFYVNSNKTKRSFKAT